MRQIVITSQRSDIRIPGLNGTIELKGVNGKAAATVGVCTHACPSDPWSSGASACDGKPFVSGAYPLGGYEFCMAVVCGSPSGVLPLMILQRESFVQSIVRRIRRQSVYNVNSRDERCSGEDEVYSVFVLSRSRGERAQLKSHICVQAGSRLVDMDGRLSSRKPSPPRARAFTFHLIGPILIGGAARHPRRAANLRRLDLGFFPVARSFTLR
jgi:hypothetical protein